MSSFLVRAVSASIASLIFIGAFIWLQAAGLKILGSIVVILAAYEILGILFKPTDSRFNRAVFYCFMVFIFFISLVFPNLAAVTFAFSAICFCVLSILTQHKFKDLNELMQFQAKSILGFFYIGLLPSFALRLLDLNHGEWWFVTLLAVVFSGDIGGYVFGNLFGKRKLMEMISPKKTVEGALGGLLCSTLAALFCWTKLDHLPLSQFVGLCFGASVVALFGDLFESQMKRVAELKDSGIIMPGHGGILDRIDGILFASPVILFGALALEYNFKF